LKLDSPTENSTVGSAGEREFAERKRGIEKESKRISI
jgi:hypothetical protein